MPYWHGKHGSHGKPKGLKTRTQTANSVTKMTGKKTPNQEQTQAQTQEIPEELKTALQVIERTVEEGKNANEWVSNPLIEGEHVIITASSLNGSLTLWLKPRTLRNGYPIIIDDHIEDRLQELEEAIKTVRQLLPHLEKYKISRSRRMPSTGAPIRIRRVY
mgnify:CR=1 FL=1